MNVLFAASECTPFAKVGGLGDVIGALPKALVETGLSVDVVLPAYKPMFEGESSLISNCSEVTRFSVTYMGHKEECILYQTTFPDAKVQLFLIKNETYLSYGGIYLSEDAIAKGNDEPLRFLFFCKAVSELFTQNIFHYDVVHCHDWHTSWLLYLLKKSSASAKLILSVHNLANVGLVTDPKINVEIDGDEREHPMIAVGVESADVVVPVSKHYAEELLRGEFTEGLDKIIQKNREKFKGITNGIDTIYFNPAEDTFLPERYDLNRWHDGKKAAKEHLFHKFKWNSKTIDSTFLFGMVGRLAPQKNIALICDYLEKHNNESVRFVFLGVGVETLAGRLRSLSLEYPDRIVFANRFDESLSRFIYAGSDGFLVPSYFEPCGLTQMIAMRYGSLPIGRKVGGLGETIDDSMDGFLFEESSVKALYWSIERAVIMWREQRAEWNQRVENAMKKDFSWTVAAEKYKQIYELK